MSKLVLETKENNVLMREHFGKDPKSPKNGFASSASTFKERTNLPHKVSTEEWSEADYSPNKNHN